MDLFRAPTVRMHLQLMAVQNDPRMKRMVMARKRKARMNGETTATTMTMTLMW